MSMQHLRGQSVHQPCRTNNGNNNNNMLLPPIAGNGLCGLNFFGVFLLKFDAHVVVAVVSCRPLPQHPKPKAKPNISSGTSSPSVPSLAMQVLHLHHSHTLAAYLNKFICNLVFAVCEHFPPFRMTRKRRTNELAVGRWAWLSVCLSVTSLSGAKIN